MTNNEILKVIEMINDNETDKAKEFLKTQLVKATDKKGYNLLALVKKYLKEADNSRPILKMIEHNSNGQQFILDGITAIKFKQHEATLDILPQADAEQSINIEAIFTTYPKYTLTENDSIILNNIDKCIDLIMADKIDKKDKRCYVKLFDKFFDLNVIKNIIKIIKGYDEDFRNTEFYTSDSKIQPIQIENDKIKAIILPIRAKDEDENKITEQTQKIIDALKGVE